MKRRSRAIVDQRAQRELFQRQVPQTQQQVVNRIDRLRLVPLVEMLQLHLRLRERFLVQQLAELRLAEELAELRLVDGQRLRAALRERRVAVVEEVGDEAEQHRSRERRRLGCVGGVHADSALADALHHLHQRRHVEDVAQRLAICLEDDRERAETRRHLQQVVRALALLPERCPSLDARARQE
jgi:hypothetical protein